MSDEKTHAELLDVAEDLLSEDLADSLADDDGATPVPPAPGEPMVVRSLRLPVEVHQRINAVAARHGLAASTLMREWIETELAAMEDDQPISRSDAVRALTMLRPVRRAA
ncbi:MAG: hypothetical protein GEV12_17430 [Micromonosporaceae bacterium]|nr:hypothetical protein [Micromonosporaceae bacterium]